MAGVFFGASLDNFVASSRQVLVGGTITSRFADNGDLQSLTDSTPRTIAETEDHLVCVAGYGFNDTAAGGDFAFDSPVYAGTKVPANTEVDYDEGCQAYLYGDGFTPVPGAVYYQGTPVPGAVLVRLQSWLTLADNHLAAADGSFLRVGAPGLPTQRSTLTVAGYTTIRARSLVLLNDGTVAVVTQATNGGTPYMLVSDPVDPLALTATLDRAGTAVYEFNGIDPWTAAPAAACVAFGNTIRKIQTHKSVPYWERWVSTLVVGAGPSSATIYTPGAQMYTPSEVTADYLSIKAATLSYSEAGGVLTASFDTGTPIFDGNLAVAGMGIGNAQTVYADSDLFGVAVTPFFWRDLAKSVEIP